jgi:serine/threonine-protein kinase
MPTTIHTLITKIVKPSKLNIVSKLADGGMAEVFSAYDGLGRNVVVRRIKPELRFALGLRHRFTHGIYVRRKMGKHRNIVEYFGHGGLVQPYEVIAYVPGEDLKTLILRKHDLVRSQPFSLLQQAADAIAHAHARGFLHLDIKPENYLVEFRQGGGVVKLSDFDLCQPIGLRAAPKGFGGSLMYAAPEFLASRAISPQTDYFAFGVLAYHLVTFQLPFAQSVASLVRSGRYEIRYPDAPPSRLSPPVRHFLERCLAERPERRFANDTEFVAAVGQMEQQHRAYVQTLDDAGPRRTVR